MSDDEEAGDPGRVIPTYVDTTVDVFGPLSLGDTLVLLPAVAAFLGAFFALLADSALVWAFVPAGMVLLLVAGGVIISTRWWTSPRERVRNWVAHLHRQRETPKAHAEAAAEAVHGVRRLRADGTAIMDDGRQVGLVEVDPTNTALAEASELDTLASQLGTVVDEDLAGQDWWWYATTETPDRDGVLEGYRERAREGDDETDLSDAAQALLGDVVGWTEDVDAEQWQAREWRFFVGTAVDPDEVRGEVRAEASWSVRSHIRQLLGRGDDDASDQVRARQHQHLTERVETLRDAIGGVEGLGAEQIDAATHAALLSRYWTGSDHDIDEDGDLMAAFERDTRPDSEMTPAQEMLAPERFDPGRGTVQVGDRLARTFWVAEWPAEPAPVFLRDVVTMRGVDVDVRLNATAADKRATMSDLDQQVADIDSEAAERAEDSDISSMDVDRDIDAWVKMREVFRSTNAEPWRVSGYITVWADTEDALDRAAESIREYDSPELAKQDALEDAAEDVIATVEGAPADCWVIPPGTRQREAFHACSPTGRDRFAETATQDKRRLMPGGALGAMFPPCAISLQERGGIDWGRNEHNGTPLTADPFERGAAPHLLTIGQSRSGKTYSASRAAQRWYLEESDRTLIVCDTQSGFDGLTQMLDGKHIVVDGQKTINPLDIQPVPDYIREASGGQVDPYRMKVDEATEFIAGVLRAQGIDPGDYVSTIEQGLEETYARAGIYPNDLDSHARESPTLGDFMDTLTDILDDPGEFAHSEHDAEMSKKVRRVSDLLDRLSGFQEGGKYHHLVGETETGLAEAGVDMAYLDLQQLQGASSAEKSVMLHLMLSQVAQKIKRTQGEAIFMIDEAHMLLHSPEMVQWLQKAAREWARYDAAMWFISQSPREFVQQAADAETGSENHRRTIVDQCSTLQFFRTPRVDTETLAKFGMNETQAEFVTDQATPGKSGKGYSEGLISFGDHRGWVPTYVEAAPSEDAVLNYTPREHGAFDEYLADEWDMDVNLGGTGDAEPDEGGTNPGVDGDDAAETAVTDGGESDE